jgi:gluconate 2-dehydrogenase gamma chain
MTDAPLTPARRRFLADLARFSAGFSAGLALEACRRDGAAPDAAADASPTAAQSATTRTSTAATAPARALLPPQRAALAAAVARIVPTDQDPGAAEANVIEYLDLELARPENAGIKTAILAGVVALNRFASQAAKKAFAELLPDEQDQLLGQVQYASARGEDFVFILTVLTLEGFLGDPKHGGNAGGVGWTFIGYGPGTVDGHVGGHHHHYE